MWYEHRFFKITVGAILILLVIFLLGQIDFFLSPFKTFVSTLFIPILAAGLFYYILRPLVRFLEKLKIPRTLAILLSFVLVLGIVTMMSTYTGSILAKQFDQITRDVPKAIESARERTTNFLGSQWFDSLPLENFKQQTADFLESATANLSSFFLGFASTLTSIGTLLVIVPFILFYFLKDDHRFSHHVLRWVPKSHKPKVSKMLEDVDTALSSYIVGQMTVALTIGILMFIGYLIIGLKYSLILALFAMFTTVIPFFGPILGILPALLVGLSMDPLMVLKVLIVMIVVQQLDGNFISPQVMGKRLDIHPLTVILLLMVGVSLYGFVGLLITIPTYAALKATFHNIYEMYWKKRVEPVLRR